MDERTVNDGVCDVDPLSAELAGESLTCEGSSVGVSRK